MAILSKNKKDNRAKELQSKKDIRKAVQELKKVGLMDKPTISPKKIKKLLGRRPVVNENKQGVNEPCACGSGRKYKKCCKGL